MTSEKAPVAALVQGRASKAVEPALVIIDTPQSWQQSLARYFTTAEQWVNITLFEHGTERRRDGVLSAASPPPVDLTSHVALGVFAGRLDDGAPWVDIERVVIEGATVNVCFSVMENMPTARAVKDPSPFALIFINRPKQAIEHIKKACP